MQKMKLDIDFTPFIKSKSKMYHRSKFESKAIKLLEKNIRENLDELGYGDIFLYTTPRA